MKNPGLLPLRAAVTGLVMGLLLTPCNIYSGLKIGWSFNMSIVSALLGFAFWRLSHRLLRTREFNLRENVFNQTCASASASIISGGLVAPIPAYQLITGQSLSLPVLILWVFLVSALGIGVALMLRRQMIEKMNLAFPAGRATAEALNDLHDHAQDHSSGSLRALLSFMGLSFLGKLLFDLVLKVRHLPVFQPFSSLYEGLAGLSFKTVAFAIEPSFLMTGYGLIMGLRTGLSLLIGAVIGWLILPPLLLDNGLLQNPADFETSAYAKWITWMLWPGVGLMVSASLTSTVLPVFKSFFSRSGLAGYRHKAKSEKSKATLSKFGPSKLALATLMTGALVLAQFLIFDIPLLLGFFAVVLSVLLGIVAARVSGETGIPPIGALGKITQVSLGVFSPANAVTNLMAANVTGGAAGQASDLLHDLKAGSLLKIPLALQVTAQVLGVAIGAVIGSAVYSLLIPDPQTQLLTEEWPAPAVQAWKSVAELISLGLSHFPEGAMTATICAVSVGFLLSLFEESRWRRWIPSPSAMGLALILPAATSLTIFLGAILGAFLGAFLRAWASGFSWRLPTQATEKLLTIIAAGLIAGESLGGLSLLIYQLF